MKKTYFAPQAFEIALETEEVLGLSFPGNGVILEDSDENNSSKSPATDFGGITLF